MKARIVNNHYYFDGSGERLILDTVTKGKPWLVGYDGKTRKFRTHGKAVAWATRKVREGRK